MIEPTKSYLNILESILGFKRILKFVYIYPNLVPLGIGCGGESRKNSTLLPIKSNYLVHMGILLGLQHVTLKHGMSFLGMRVYEIWLQHTLELKRKSSF